MNSHTLLFGGVLMPTSHILADNKPWKFSRTLDTWGMLWRFQCYVDTLFWMSKASKKIIHTIKEGVNVFIRKKFNMYSNLWRFQCCVDTLFWMSKASKKIICTFKEGVNVFIIKRCNIQTYEVFNAMLTPCFECQKVAKIHMYVHIKR